MRRTLVVVGLGNIGSHLVAHLARMPEVSRVVLVDQGRYDDTNLRTQAITPGEVGRRKAQVQGLRLKRINPSLEVIAVGRPVEAVPLGRLRGDAILACVDSRAARQYLNQAARHLGVPLIDAGVHPDGLLARVSTFLPGAQNACLECTWDQVDYDALEQSYPCLGGAPRAASTGAPAHLGALAAAVQAIECERLLCGPSSPAADGSQEIVIDAASRRQQVTRFVPNAACRLSEHEPWSIRRLDRLPDDMTVIQALALGSKTRSAHGAGLSLDGISFITRLTCLECGHRTPVFGLRRGGAGHRRACGLCGGRLEATGADIVSSLALDVLPEGTGARSLKALGFEPGDVFAVRRREHTGFFELAGTGTRATRQ